MSEIDNDDSYYRLDRFGNTKATARRLLAAKTTYRQLDLRLDSSGHPRNGSPKTWGQ